MSCPLGWLYPATPPTLVPPFTFPSNAQFTSLPLLPPTSPPMESFRSLGETEPRTVRSSMTAPAWTYRKKPRSSPLPDRENPETATTYGVGELIKDAVEEGCEKIILGLGGSATNDCGCGMAAALGCVFRDRSGKRFVPAGGSLKEISQIDPSGISRSVLNCDIIAMCDVNNPLYGPMGAAYIYGPQKGADPDMVERLDQGLRHFAGKLPCAGGEKTALLPGAGAAGGMGAGAVAFLRARLMSGIDVVLDTVGFEDKIRNADAVFTGEGKLDKQSMMGKVVGGIARRAEKSHVPVIVLAGCVSEEMTAMENPGIAAAFCINPNPDSYLELKEKSMANLEWTMRNIARLIRAARP